jgi:hypothetical protein
MPIHRTPATGNQPVTFDTPAAAKTSSVVAPVFVLRCTIGSFQKEFDIAKTVYYSSLERSNWESRNVPRPRPMT